MQALSRWVDACGVHIDGWKTVANAVCAGDWGLAVEGLRNVGSAYQMTLGCGGRKAPRQKSSVGVQTEPGSLVSSRAGSPWVEVPDASSDTEAALAAAAAAARGGNSPGPMLQDRGSQPGSAAGWGDFVVVQPGDAPSGLGVAAVAADALGTPGDQSGSSNASAGWEDVGGRSPVPAPAAAVVLPPVAAPAAAAAASPPGHKEESSLVEVPLVSSSTPPPKQQSQRGFESARPPRTLAELFFGALGLNPEDPPPPTGSKQ